MRYPLLICECTRLSGITAATPDIRYYGPGIYHESINAHSGDTIYLAGGAVVFGSLNIWRVHDVHVEGAGVIIYDGPQNPYSDKGWMHKTDWHAVVMDNAHNIEIDGITCITRSRSWQIQMRDSRHIGFYNVKVIGGNPNDANQDGMDWEEEIRHVFSDAKGTLLDYTGRFRVLLHIVDTYEKQAWSSQSIVVSNTSNVSRGGLTEAKALDRNSADLFAGKVFERLLKIPANGGYTFTLLTSTDETISIDDLAPHHTPKARPQVCGSKGNAVQSVRISAVLSAGEHRIRIVHTTGTENADALPGTPAAEPALLWEGPGLDRQPIPQTYMRNWLTLRRLQ